MLNIVASVVPLTTDLMVCIFGPIRCACVAEVLQCSDDAILWDGWGPTSHKLVW